MKITDEVTALRVDEQLYVERRRTDNRTWSVREEAFSLALLRLAQASVRRWGLPHEEAQDCGIGFVVHMLIEDTLRARMRTGEEISPVWLHTCVEHWTANIGRCRRRLCTREHLAADPLEVTHALPSVWITRREAEMPEAQVIRLELMQRLLAVTLSLTDGQRDLFTLRYLQERSIAEVAYHTGRSYSAVKQALANLRQRLHALLIREGLTLDEVSQYLHLFSSPTLPAVAGTRHTHEA